MEDTTRTLDDIIGGLKGFGISECEEIITLEVGSKKVNLRISNLPVEEELNALLASDEFKGHMWIQRIRAEVISRSISWINGMSITGDELVTHPLRDNINANIRVVLRDILLTWGIESLSILWKILMVHNQRIEDKLIESFPDTVVLTNFEQRFLQQTMRELEESQQDLVTSIADATIDKE